MTKRVTDYNVYHSTMQEFILQLWEPLLYNAYLHGFFNSRYIKFLINHVSPFTYALSLG